MVPEVVLLSVFINYMRQEKKKKYVHHIAVVVLILALDMVGQFKKNFLHYRVAKNRTIFISKKLWYRMNYKGDSCINMFVFIAKQRS